MSLGRIDGILETQPIKTMEQYELLPYAQQLTASDTITPTSGKKIQLVWVQIIADPDASAGNLVTLTMTINSVSTDIYKVYALGRTAVFTGDTNAVLSITLENSQPVTVNIQYREIS
jgi:hypothetical protein